MLFKRGGNRVRPQENIPPEFPKKHSEGWTECEDGKFECKPQSTALSFSIPKTVREKMVHCRIQYNGASILPMLANLLKLQSIEAENIQSLMCNNCPELNTITVPQSRFLLIQRCPSLKKCNIANVTQVITDDSAKKVLASNIDPCELTLFRVNGNDITNDVQNLHIKTNQRLQELMGAKLLQQAINCQPQEWSDCRECNSQMHSIKMGLLGEAVTVGQSSNRASLSDRDQGRTY